MEHNFFSPLGIIDNLLIGVSSIRQAVATEIAPKTPIERWHRCGINVRVFIIPLFRGLLTIVIFGTVFSFTSPRFIIFPHLSRRDSRVSLRALFFSSSSTFSLPLRPSCLASIITHGIPLSIIVTEYPSISSFILPLGKSSPHRDPSISRNSNEMGELGKVTPSMYVFPL